MKDWKQLLAADRFRVGDANRKKTFQEFMGSADFRNDHEKDFDRIVFSAPVRRLQDKTQVFPLDQHDSVRTRLTHSLEVANIGRTLGAQLVCELDLKETVPGAERIIPALVGAISIAHDIGNPPFGHQGEAAIRLWVAEQAKALGTMVSSEQDRALLNDYLYFDGNPQGFRLLTMFGIDVGGLNLTASTLRASFKYPWGSDNKKIDPNKPKFGYFQTEKSIFDWATDVVGLGPEDRHPLASLMEASDDVCYSILDVEDGVKKQLVSTAHLMLFLRNESTNTKANQWVGALIQQYDDDVKWLDENKVYGQHAEDILMQLLRSHLIALLVSNAAPRLCEAIKSGDARKGNPCLAHAESSDLLNMLKTYTKRYIYSHPSVEKVELEGHRIIPYLLEAFWRSLEALEDDRPSKLDQYVAKKISPNYRRVYEVTRKSYPAWYARLQVCCDMVCGMTDSFALSTAAEFEELGVRCYG